MSVLSLIAQGESKTLEFKRELPRFEQIAKTVIAFANTSGGKLLIGVDDNGSLVGVDDDSVLDIQDRIYASLYEQIHPTLRPEIYTSHVEDKLILMVEVFRGQSLPYFLKSKGKAEGVYIRVGASNRPASLDYIAELERQKQHLSFDEEACVDVELSTLDLSTLKQRFAVQHKVLDDAKLRNFRLIQTVQGKDYPSYGLLILLGYFEHVSTQCARFKGTDMQVFLDRKEYTGDLFAQLENSEMFIKNHLFLRGEIKGLQRTDSLEIPESAIREALVNAYVHRDYSNFGRNIKIGIYDDVLNIVSAGGFPNTLTVQDLAEGRSEIRNRVLARVFKALDYIEQWGSGLQRIKQVCVAQGLPEPKIQESGDFVDVELYRPTNSVAAEKTVESGLVQTITDDYKQLRTITDDYGRLAVEQQQILLYLLAHNTMSRKDVVERLGVEKTKAHVLLSGLLELGLITRQGRGRATVYVLDGVKKWI